MLQTSFNLRTLVQRERDSRHDPRRISMHLLGEDGMRQKKTAIGRSLGVVFMFPAKHNEKKKRKKTTKGIWLKALKARFLASQQL